MAKNSNDAAKDAAKKALAAAAAKKETEKKKVTHTYTEVGGQSIGKEELLEATRKNALPYRRFAVRRCSRS